MRFIVGLGFRMATLKMVAGALRKGDHVVSLDLSDAYFHLSVSPSFRHFLRFKFKGKLFQFKAMPFGLSSAPLMFTRITRPITLFAADWGLESYSILTIQLSLLVLGRKLSCIETLLSLLKRLGFLINL